MSIETSARKRSTAPFWVTIILLGLFLGISVFFNIGLGTALVLFGSTGVDLEDDHAVDEFPVFEEEWSYGDGEIKAVRISVDGVIMRETETGFFEQPIDMIAQLTRAIRAASNDENVQAIILEVNSPGGGITESDEIYHALMRFKDAKENRRVIVFMRDLAASGGYYIAMAGDWIIAEPTTVIGSIGVIMQTINWKVLTDKIGISDVTIKSGDNKDMLNPFRETSPEELALLQEIIDSMHSRFKDLIVKGRGLDAATVSELADGRVFSADKALEIRLIDEIGYWDQVVAKTHGLLGTDEVKFIRYYQTEDFWDYLLGMRARLAAPFQQMRNPRPFQYLWHP